MTSSIGRPILFTITNISVYEMNATLRLVPRLPPLGLDLGQMSCRV